MSAAAYIAETMDRAQRCFEAMVNPTRDTGHTATINFVAHVTTVILLENLRRLDPALADRLTTWALDADGIFTDGYPAELLHEWRQQAAAGLPLDPIGPDAVSTGDGAR